MGKTNISWTNYTHNFWYGCKKVSPGCRYCYAEREMKRFGKDFNTVTRAKGFISPLMWKEPSMVFVNSWSDFFIEEADDWRDEAWDIICRTPQLTYQILTKRPENILSRLPDDWGDGYPNVWLGVSAENQENADKRIPLLIQIPSIVYFVSCEPLLGPIDLSKWIGYNPVHEEKQRGNGLSSSIDGGITNRQPGSNLESSKKRVGSLEEKSCDSQMRESSSRKPITERLSANKGDVQKNTLQRISSSISMVPFQWTDSKGETNESQERDQERQSPGESRINDTIGEHTAYDSSVEEGTSDQSERGRQQHVQADRESDKGNPKTEAKRGITYDDSQRLQYSFPDSIENSTRGQMETPRFWVIVGGESGPNYRPMYIKWVRDIYDQCQEHKVPFFMKQDSGSKPGMRGRIPDDLWVQEFPDIKMA